MYIEECHEAAGQCPLKFALSDLQSLISLMLFLLWHFAADFAVELLNSFSESCCGQEMKEISPQYCTFAILKFARDAVYLPDEFALLILLQTYIIVDCH